MKAKVMRPVEVDIKYLRIKAPFEYEFDYLSEEEQEQFKDSMTSDMEYWYPLINIDKGRIENWRKGFNYSCYFKFVDEGIYKFQDENCVTFLKHEGYVPDFLGIDDRSFGDYICITVDGDGYIKNWNAERVVQYIEAFAYDENQDLDE